MWLSYVNITTFKKLKKIEKSKIKNSSYYNNKVIEVFNENLEFVYENRINYKHNINKENVLNLIKMTLLTSSLEDEDINKLVKADISAITIDLKVIVGKKISN